MSLSTGSIDSDIRLRKILAQLGTRREKPSLGISGHCAPAACKQCDQRPDEDRGGGRKKREQRGEAGGDPRREHRGPRPPVTTSARNPPAPRPPAPAVDPIRIAATPPRTASTFSEPARFDTPPAEVRGRQRRREP